MTDRNAIEVVDTVLVDNGTEVVNRGAATRTHPFGITAKPRSREYHRQYSRAYMRQLRDHQKVERKQVSRVVNKPLMTQHMTLREIAKSQGWPLDGLSMMHLRERLLARQKLTGVAIVFRLSVYKTTPARNCTGRYYTTLALLRRHASELFDEPAEQAEAVKHVLAELRQQITDLRDDNRKVRARLKRLEVKGC